MDKLSQASCEICRTGAPSATDEEIALYMQDLPDWQIVSQRGVNHLIRHYTFSNFLAAIEFTNQVAQLAEQENHHPALLTEWGKVQVSWWTHKINGLHKNDFITAAKTDLLYTPATKE